MKGTVWCLYDGSGIMGLPWAVYEANKKEVI